MTEAVRSAVRAVAEVLAAEVVVGQTLAALNTKAGHRRPCGRLAPAVIWPRLDER